MNPTTDIDSQVNFIQQSLVTLGISLFKWSQFKKKLSGIERLFVHTPHIEGWAQD